MKSYRECTTKVFLWTLVLHSGLDLYLARVQTTEWYGDKKVNDYMLLCLCRVL